MKKAGKAGVVAFAFGTPRNIFSNHFIEAIATLQAFRLDAPVYTQRDIFLRDLVEPDVEYIEEEPGKPPSTLRIARGAVQWAKRRGLKELWIAAAKPHLWRALRDVKQAVHEAGEKITVHACKEIEHYQENKWFCSDSTQRRTRSKKAFERRERILGSLPFWFYKLIDKLTDLSFSHFCHFGN